LNFVFWKFSKFKNIKLTVSVGVFSGDSSSKKVVSGVKGAFGEFSSSSSWSGELFGERDFLDDTHKDFNSSSPEDSFDSISFWIPSTSFISGIA